MSEQQSDTPWWYYALGGAAVIGGLGYISYRAARAAAPYALAYGAPELLPYYEGWEKASTPEQRRDVVMRGIDAAVRGDVSGVKQMGRLDAAPDVDKLPRIEQWRWDNLMGEDFIAGYVYGKPGVKDGERIEITPLLVQGNVAMTGRSRYRLGKPA